METLESLSTLEGGFPAHRPESKKTNTPAYKDDLRWQLACRIASSRSLGRSRLLADFLFYIVDRSIRGRADEITEQQIGILVFGRAEGYDSNEDNIVRSYARNLRKRIEDYFTAEGHNEPMRLEIPRGGYAPVFIPIVEKSTPSPFQLAEAIAAPEITAPPQQEKSLPSPPEAEAQSVPPSPRKERPVPFLLHLLRLIRTPRYAVPLALCCGILAGLLVGKSTGSSHVLKHLGASAAQRASCSLWAQIFNDERDTFIVPSDDGLVIMQRLADYVNGRYRSKARLESPADAEIYKLGGRRYTNVVDLNFISRLAQLDEVAPQRMVVRYARDLRMDDLATGNAVLFGSVEANPWIELFLPHMNFRQVVHVGSSETSGLSNTHPRPGEKLIYGTPNENHTYGVIAYLPNLTSTGHVLIVGGLNTAGTEAAATFLLTPALMLPTLEHAKGPNGVIQPFEVLIGANNIATHASTPLVVAERIGPQ